MIVNSNNLVLTDKTSPEANAPVIGYDNVLTPGDIAASSETTGYPATNLGNPSTGSLWRASSAVSSTVVASYNSGSTFVDFMGIARHNLGTAGATVSLTRDSVTIIPAFVPSDDRPLILRWTPATVTSNLTLVINNPTVTPEIAVMYAGLLLPMQRKLYVEHRPITMSRNFNVTTNVAQNGSYLGSVVLQRGNDSEASFKNLTPAWVRSTLDPFLEVCRQRPSFWAWRPSKYPLETGYVWITNNPKPINQRNNGMMSVDFQFGGLA